MDLQYHWAVRWLNSLLDNISITHTGTQFPTKVGPFLEAKVSFHMSERNTGTVGPTESSLL